MKENKKGERIIINGREKEFQIRKVRIVFVLNLT